MREPNEKYLIGYSYIVGAGGVAAAFTHRWWPFLTPFAAMMAIMTLGLIRDEWAKNAAGTPEAIGVPAGLSRRQRTAWRVLHLIDPLWPPVPVQVGDPTSWAGYRGHPHPSPECGWLCRTYCRFEERSIKRWMDKHGL